MNPRKRNQTGNPSEGIPYTGECEPVVMVNDEEVAGLEIFALMVQKEANRIPRAQLSIREGDAASQDFPASQAFKVGDQIKLSASMVKEGKRIPLFEGEVLKMQVRLYGAHPTLLLEAKDIGFRTCQTRHNRVFEDQRDDQVLDRILDPYQLEVDLGTIGSKHRELVQFNATDWDFLVSRAEANGLLAYLNDGQLKLKAPAVETAASTLAYGRDLLDFEGSISAERQYDAFEASSWDHAEQEWLSAQPNSGRLSTTDSSLSGNQEKALYHGGYRSRDELIAWANAKQVLADYSRVRGRAKAFGLDIAPGASLRLEGVGPHFSGDHLITGVVHELHNNSWTTALQFGLTEDCFAESHPDMTALPAGGLLPGIQGLQTGVVDRYETDPGSGYRIGVRLVAAEGGQDILWARLATMDAGKEHGFFWVPDIDDEVILGFMNGDPRDAIILGSVYSAKYPPPEQYSDKNELKGYYSQAKSRLLFNDADGEKSIELSTAESKNILLINGNKNEISLEDKNGNKIVMNDQGISLESFKDLNIKAQKNITINGTDVEAKGTTSIKLKGNATAELSSLGETVVKAPMVQLNPPK